MPMLPMTSLEPYEEIAQLIAGPGAPAWLPEHFKRWAPCIFLGSAVEKRQPSRSEMRTLLYKIKNAAELLQRALGEPSIQELLEVEPLRAIENLGGLDRSLRDVAHRADCASKSPALTTKTGKTKAGRGVNRLTKLTPDRRPKLTRSENARATARALAELAGVAQPGRARWREARI